MYLIIRITLLGLFVFAGNSIYAQNEEKRNNNSLEIGLGVGGDETLFYGGHGKYRMPLTQGKHYFTAGLALSLFFDFKGESTSEAYLKKDFDMRIIPTFNFGYSLNFKKLQLNFEVPFGASIAITKGTLVNEKIGFERDFDNQEIFWSYGLSFSPKYRINRLNQIGAFAFLPLVKDKAQSGYQFGIGWTKTFANNTGLYSNR